MSVSIDLTGEPEVRRMFAEFAPAELAKKATKAGREGAKVVKPEIAKDARPFSKRMSRAVAVRAARKAKDRPGAIVVFKRKGPAQSSAFFAHFVILGTRDHGPRSKPYMAFTNDEGQSVRTRRVRGVAANQFVAPAVDRKEREALDVMIRELGL